MNFGEQYNYNNLGDSNEQNQQQPYVVKVSDLYGAARVQFIRKVYSVLSSIFFSIVVQLIITFLMTALSMTSQAFFLFQIQNTWLFFLAMITLIVI
jgi:hypothetical protein